MRTGPSDLSGSGTDGMAGLADTSALASRQARSLEAAEPGLGTEWLTPAHLPAAVANGAWAGTGDPLQMIRRHHHNGNPHVASGTAEI